MTKVYLVRHCDSPYEKDQEYNRGLSKKGIEDAKDLVKLFENLEIKAVVSSAYQRAIDTVRFIAQDHQLSIQAYDELIERHISKADLPWPDIEIGIKKSFEDIDFKLAGGESTRQAQDRVIHIFEMLLQTYNEQSFVIGSHGNIMTILLKYYRPEIGYEFWKSLDMPDVIEVEFEGNNMVGYRKYE